MSIKCAFCESETLDLETAAAADWVPGYWSAFDDEEYFDRPVCPECAAKHLHTDCNGESEAKS